MSISRRNPITSARNDAVKILEVLDQQGNLLGTFKLNADQMVDSGSLSASHNTLRIVSKRFQNGSGSPISIGGHGVLLANGKRTAGCLNGCVSGKTPQSEVCAKLLVPSDGVEREKVMYVKVRLSQKTL